MNVNAIFLSLILILSLQGSLFSAVGQCRYSLKNNQGKDVVISLSSDMESIFSREELKKIDCAHVAIGTAVDDDFFPIDENCATVFSLADKTRKGAIALNKECDSAVEEKSKTVFLRTDEFSYLIREKARWLILSAVENLTSVIDYSLDMTSDITLDGDLCEPEYISHLVIILPSCSILSPLKRNIAEISNAITSLIKGLKHRDLLLQELFLVVDDTDDLSYYQSSLDKHLNKAG